MFYFAFGISRLHLQPPSHRQLIRLLFFMELFGIQGYRCLTESALLDCHVLKGFGIHTIGILDSLSDLWKPFSGTHHVTSSVLDNIKGIESPFFLFRPLTKLAHPNTIYRYIRPGVCSGVLALEPVFSRVKRGRRTHFVNRRDGVQTFKLGP